MTLSFFTSLSNIFCLLLFSICILHSFPVDAAKVRWIQHPNSLLEPDDIVEYDTESSSDENEIVETSRRQKSKEQNQETLKDISRTTNTPFVIDQVKNRPPISEHDRSFSRMNSTDSYLLSPLSTADIFPQLVPSGLDLSSDSIDHAISQPQSDNEFYPEQRQSPITSPTQIDDSVSSSDSSSSSSSYSSERHTSPEATQSISTLQQQVTDAVFSNPYPPGQDFSVPPHTDQEPSQDNLLPSPLINQQLTTPPTPAQQPLTINIGFDRESWEVKAPDNPLQITIPRSLFPHLFQKLEDKPHSNDSDADDETYEPENQKVRHKKKKKKLPTPQKPSRKKTQLSINPIMSHKAKETTTKPTARVRPVARVLPQPPLFAVSEYERDQLQTENQRIRTAQRSRAKTKRVTATSTDQPGPSRSTLRKMILESKNGSNNEQEQLPEKTTLDSSEDSEGSEDIDSSDYRGKPQTNYKGHAYRGFSKEKLANRIKEMIENDWLDSRHAKYLDTGRYGMPKKLRDKYKHWSAPAVRDAIKILAISDTRNLEQRRLQSRIKADTFVSRIETYIKPSPSRRSTMKNGVLADGSRSDGRTAYYLNQCNLPVPQAVIYAEEQRKDNAPCDKQTIQRLIDNATPNIEARWNAMRIRLAIKHYQIPDPRKGQHHRKGRDRVELANDSKAAFRVLLLDYLTDRVTGGNRSFSSVASRLSGNVWVPEDIRKEVRLEENTKDWTAKLVEAAVWSYGLHFEGMQKFARKDNITAEMRRGGINDKKRMASIKEYLLVSLEDMLLLRVSGIYSRIASRIKLLGILFPTCIAGGAFRGTHWGADWVRAAFKHYKIKIPYNVKIQRRFLIVKMRGDAINSSDRIQSIRDYVESLSTTRSYTQIAQNLRDLSRTRGSDEDDTPIYIPTIFGGSSPPNQSCHWLNHHISQVMGDYSQGGHNRPDLVEIIQNEEVEPADRILALSQYIDHIKFKFTYNNPKPKGERARKSGIHLVWKKRLHKKITDNLNSIGAYIPPMLIEKMGDTFRLYDNSWSSELSEAADKKLGEVWFWHQPQEDDELLEDDDEQEQDSMPDAEPLRASAPKAVPAMRVRKGFVIPKNPKATGSTSSKVQSKQVEQRKDSKGKGEKAPRSHLARELPTDSRQKTLVSEHATLSPPNPLASSKNLTEFGGIYDNFSSDDEAFD